MSKHTLKIDTLKAWRNSLLYVPKIKKSDDDSETPKAKDKITWANRS